MAQLDDLVSLTRIDASGMLDQMASFPSQLRSSLQSSPKRDVEADTVLVGGLGGSAMGGDVLAEYMALNSSAPTFVVRDTTLPRWADDRTLVILISYSGNTKETISMYRSARERNCPTVVITSGGSISEMAMRDAIDVVHVPPGFQPRAALGHLLGSAASVVESAGLAPMASDLRSFVPKLDSIMNDLMPTSPEPRNTAKQIARRLLGTLPFVYAPRPLRSAATRWQTQINENSKMLCLSGEAPEMDHNQIVGWIDGDRDERNRPVMLLPRNGQCDATSGMRTTIDLLAEHGIDTVIADLDGSSPLESALHGVMLGDFVSYYLAMLREVDPTPVQAITELKARR